MRLIELGKSPLVGELNTNELMVDTSGLVLLKRVPKENTIILRSIAHEYHNIGFADAGGKFRRRTPEEQAKFAEYAALQGLRVVPPIMKDGKITYFPFLTQAKTLDKYLPEASDEETAQTIYQLFTDMRKAHNEKGVIYGDRWSKNILIDPNAGAMHIDFDIEISGHPAKEFDVAQLTYYILCDGREKTVSFLASMLSRSFGWFNPKLVDQFLRGHAKHFRDTKQYGHAEEITDALIGFSSKKREKVFSDKKIEI
jgi:hypothetical protein